VTLLTVACLRVVGGSWTTRFTEGRPIERAIEHRDANELGWAQAYREYRIRSTRVKRALGHWPRLLKQTTDALGNPELRVRPRVRLAARSGRDHDAE